MQKRSPESQVWNPTNRTWQYFANNCDFAMDSGFGRTTYNFYDFWSVSCDVWPLVNLVELILPDSQLLNHDHVNCQLDNPLN